MIVAVGIPALLLRAWAVVTLWAWFVVPAFDVRPIGYASTIGILILLGLLHSQAQYKDHEIDLTTSLIGSATGPLMAVGIGWLVKHFAGL